MESPQTFGELIFRLDEEAKKYAHIGDIKKERLMRILSTDVALCYARETFKWMENLYKLEEQRSKAIEALGESITSDFKKRLETIEAELAKEKE